MSLKIWKYPLLVADSQELQIPHGYTILSVQSQRGVPALWALVETDYAAKQVIIRMVGTGHPIEFDTSAYIGTFQIDDGNLVFHAFEDRS